MKNTSKTGSRAGARVEIDAPAAFTISNAVFVAVLQVSVIVMGCLGAGLSYHLTESFGGSVQLPTVLLLRYWFVFMAVPLVWLTTALQLRRRPDVTLETKGTIFWFGVFLLAALVVLGLCALFGPLLMPRPGLMETVEGSVI